MSEVQSKRRKPRPWLLLFILLAPLSASLIAWRQSVEQRRQLDQRISEMRAQLDEIGEQIQELEAKNSTEQPASANPFDDGEGAKTAE